MGPGFVMVPLLPSLCPEGHGRPALSFLKSPVSNPMLLCGPWAHQRGDPGARAGGPAAAACGSYGPGGGHALSYLFCPLPLMEGLNSGRASDACWTIS